MERCRIGLGGIKMSNKAIVNLIEGKYYDKLSVVGKEVGGWFNV